MVTHGNSLFKHIFKKIVRSWDVGLHGHPGNAWLGHTLFQFLKPHKILILSCMECLAWPLDVRCSRANRDSFGNAWPVQTYVFNTEWRIIICHIGEQPGPTVVYPIHTRNYIWAPEHGFSPPKV